MKIKMLRGMITGIIFAIAICLVSCQPTPETDIIQNKKDDALINIIENTNNVSDNPSEQGLSQDAFTWTDELKISDSLSVSINASVSIPAVTSYPVYQVEPDCFDVESVTHIKEVLFGDAQLYDVDPAEGIKHSKSEIEEMIVSTKQALNDPNSDLNQMTDIKTQSELRKIMQESLETLEKEYIDAPEKVEYDPIDITQENLKKGLFSVLFQEEGAIGFYVSDIDDDLGRHNSITCYFPRDKRDSVGMFQAFTQVDAETIATDFIKKLNTEMSVNRTVVVNENNDTNYKCYDVIFTKEYNGIPETYTEQDQADITMSENMYTCPWSYEKIIVRADNLGVWFFQWYSPSKIVKQMSENVEIMPFEKIKEIFLNQIGYSNAWIDQDEHIVSRDLFITEVRLGMMRVSIKDSIDKYMVIPVWDFFGYTVDKYDAQQPGGYALNENNEYTNVVEAHSFLTVNGIDGSIIDRNLGY